MPELILKGSGRRVFVAPEALPDAVASGLYETPDADQAVTVEVRPGLVGQTTVGDLDAALAGGALPESEKTFRGRERAVRIEREHGGPIDTVKTFVESGLNEATLGLTGAVGELVGGEEYTERRLERQEANPIASKAGTAAGIIGGTVGTGGAGTVGRIARATPLGAATTLGSRIARTGEGASFATKAGRAALGGAVEGGIVGVGQGVQQLTDTSDPLTWERAMSTIGSNFLTGATTGGAFGVGGKILERGLSKARRALDEAAQGAAPGVAVADDLAKLDRQGLRVAEADELARIEAARVSQRAQVADELRAFRNEVKENKLFLATKNAEDAEVRALAARSAKADKQLRNLIDNPKRLAKKPELAEAALQQQESALEELVTKHRDNLRAKFAGDTSGERLKALDFAETALERNRALQAKLTDIAAKPTSDRLAAIANAADALVSGGAKKTLPEQMLESTVFGVVTGAAAEQLPGPFGVLAPMIGAKAAGAVSGLVFKRMSKASGLVTQRTAKAVGAFLDASRKVAPAAPVIATKVLSSVAFAPSKKTDPDAANQERTKEKKRRQLAELYRARTSELRSQVAIGEDGVTRMRPHARAAIAKRLDPIALVSPVLADQMEALAAKRIEFLASKMPRRPEVLGMAMGPDDWQPSDMQMRAWARYVAAAEDPGAIEERLAEGSVTPEDAEVMRELYPERLAELKRQIIMALPTLQKKLPYQRRLALSMLTGVAVDPALDPNILARLQASFVLEEGTDGGSHAPKPEPQFGSVSREALTPAQARNAQL